MPANRNYGDRYGRQRKYESSEFGGCCAAGQRGGNQEKVPAPGFVETPERDDHAQNHCRHEVFDEQRTGDQGVRSGVLAKSAVTNNAGARGSHRRVAE